MSAQNVNFQCPACTGPLHYGVGGMLECEYCGSSFSVQQIEALYKDKEEAATNATAAETETVSSDDGYSESDSNQGLRVYNCTSCGAEIICDETTAATSCPYCGNPTIIPGQFNGDFKPDYVIPFKLEKKDAVNSLKNYYKGKRLLPKEFSDANHIEEIKGVYVPFWIVDSEADTSLSFQASKVSMFSTPRERITITDHFNVFRSATVPFSSVPVDASSKMPNDYMDAIEPFDFTQMVKFSTAYLPGFLADKYDQTIDECFSRVKTRAETTATQVVQSDVQGYSTCMPTSRNVNVRMTDHKQALLPVWLLSTKWNGNTYLFAMNGQTGKMIGDLPISKSKLAGWFFGVSLPLMALLTIIMLFV